MGRVARNHRGVMSAKDGKPKSSRPNLQTRRAPHGLKPHTRQKATAAPPDQTEPGFSDIPHWTELTSKERKVVGMLIDRFTEQEIADALGVARSTAKFHMQNVYNKLGVHDRFAFRSRFGESRIRP